MTLLAPDSRQLDFLASLCLRVIDSDFEHGKPLLQLFGARLGSVPGRKLGLESAVDFGAVLAFRILRPIQRETIVHKPFSDIGTGDGTGCYSPPILICGDWRTIDRQPRDEGIEIIRCLRATALQVAVRAPA